MGGFGKSTQSRLGGRGERGNTAASRNLRFSPRGRQKTKVGRGGPKGKNLVSETFLLVLGYSGGEKKKNGRGGEANGTTAGGFHPEGGGQGLSKTLWGGSNSSVKKKKHGDFIGTPRPRWRGGSAKKKGKGRFSRLFRSGRARKLRPRTALRRILELETNREKEEC